MATPDWIASTEEIVGANHPNRPDVKNRQAINQNTTMLAEHTQDGKHNSKATAVIGEVGSFTGNGTSQTITLTNTDLVPKKVYVWEKGNTDDCFRLDVFSNSWIPNGAKEGRAQSITFSNNVIDNFQAGSFDVEDTINRSGVTNYYLVIGTGWDSSITPTGNPAAGSNPTWVPSGTLVSAPMIGTDNATVGATNYANSVESEIWTNFLVGHTVDGVHSVDPFPGKQETGWYEGNSGARTITLTNTNLDIKYLWLFREDGGGHGKCENATEDMSGETKREGTAALYAARITSLNTGSFDVAAIINGSGNDYFWFAIGE